MLQKITIGQIEEELLTINYYQNSVYLETLHYMYILETESDIASKKIFEKLSDIYMEYRLKNPLVKMDLYQVLGELTEYKFICTETNKYDTVLQILLPNGIYTTIKCYTDGVNVYLILDGYTFSYISLQFEERFANQLNNIVAIINQASKESKLLTVKKTVTGHRLDIYTHEGTTSYNVGYSLNYK